MNRPKSYLGLSNLSGGAVVSGPLNVKGTSTLAEGTVTGDFASNNQVNPTTSFLFIPLGCSSSSEEVTVKLSEDIPADVFLPNGEEELIEALKRL